MTLRELVTRLALSPTAVSRALNGHADVGEPIRRRVVAAAEATG